MPTRFCAGAILLGGLWLTACSTLQTTSSRGPTTTAYMQGYTGKDIIEYSVSPSRGSPAGVLNLPPSYSFFGMVATDPAGQIYAFATDGAPNYKILVYPPNSTGAAVPLRTVDISVPYASAFAVGPSGLLYVLQGGNNGGTSVTVYTIGPNGVAVPLHTLQVSTIETLTDVAVDMAGNIYVVGATSPGHSSSPYAIEVMQPRRRELMRLFVASARPLPFLELELILLATSLRTWKPIMGRIVPSRNSRQTLTVRPHQSIPSTFHSKRPTEFTVALFGSMGRGMFLCP